MVKSNCILPFLNELRDVIALLNVLVFCNLRLHSNWNFPKSQ
nr:MAG TPA: hypothetical protein [Caudoviricetes sp.]